MRSLLIAAALLQLALGASIVDVSCPDSCTCQVKDGRLETSCSSSEFIKKLIPKQVSTIVSLKINNASLVNVDSKLKYLKNLHSLDLSNNSIGTLPSQFPYLPKLRDLNLSSNHLSSVVFGHLPKNLEVVDLSNNSLVNFPEDWASLKQLTTLYFHDNPIDCGCNNLLIYEQLLTAKINIPKNLTCHYPKEFYGRLLNSVNCSLSRDHLLNLMLGDEAGSGVEDSDILEDNSLLSDDKEFINAEGIVENTESELNEEGSGEEGSGYEIPIKPIPKACHFNCSTPPPIGLHDEKNASPPPSVKDQVAIIFEDLLHPDQENDKTTVAPTTPEVPTEEPVVVKKVAKSQVETVPTNNTVLGEMERASVDGSGNQSVYIIVGLLIAFVTFLIIYLVNKRRNKNKRTPRRRNKSNENGFGEELKPLGKSAETAKPVEQVNSKVPNAEAAPLLNGQNGKLNEENNIKAQPAEEDNKDQEDVEIRKPDKQELLTPQPARVTIKAGELPDSVPKTPLLVQRHVNSDGEIVTTKIN